MYCFVQRKRSQRVSVASAVLCSIRPAGGVALRLLRPVLAVVDNSGCVVYTERVYGRLDETLSAHIVNGQRLFGELLLLTDHRSRAKSLAEAADAS
jgi:hypothetical protein